MQVRAIVEATSELLGEGVKAEPEIMIPLVAHVRELEVLRRETLAATAEVAARYGLTIRPLVGTMIELPRAALTANQIAREADFFSLEPTISPRRCSVSAATIRVSSCPHTSSATSCQSIRSSPLIRTVSVSSCGLPCNAVDRRGLTSRLGSVANTAATQIP